jgi:hypothetical protein
VGARLVSAAINPHWSQLTDLQFRVLTIMAITSLDVGNGRHSRAVYWAGHDYLALCVFGTDAPEERHLHAVKRAISGLVKLGAIEPMERATGRRRARYRLILDEFNQPPLPKD